MYSEKKCVKQMKIQSVNRKEHFFPFHKMVTHIQYKLYVPCTYSSFVTVIESWFPTQFHTMRDYTWTSCCYILLSQNVTVVHAQWLYSLLSVTVNRQPQFHSIKRQTKRVVLYHAAKRIYIIQRKTKFRICS